MKTLTIESVGLHGFVSEELTEGKIAVNGDRTTPVFSPYSGRVTRVIAGLGDTVKKGAPLATIEASEFVQAQNDLAHGGRAAQARAHQRDPQARAATMPRAAACRTGSRRRRISPRRRPRCIRCATGSRSSASPMREIDALEAAHTIDAGGDAHRADRRRGGGSPGRSGPVPAGRRRHAGVHDRRSVERVAARQRARGRLRLGAARAGRGSSRARLSEAHLRRRASPMSPRWSIRSRTACRCGRRSTTATAR